jgi:hypothetical protein
MTPELERAVKRYRQWFGSYKKSDAIWRVYRAYWKTHPLIMALIAFSVRRRIESRKQVLIRVHPDEPNPLAGVTDPAV